MNASSFFGPALFNGTMRRLRSGCVLLLALGIAAAVLFLYPAHTTAEPESKITLDIRADRDNERLSIVPGSGMSFRDCADPQPCPEMVVVPASEPGGFLIGSPETEAGRLGSEAQHSKSVGAFAIGKYEVRVDEYMACVTANACRHPEWAEPDGQHNVFTGSGVTYSSIKDYLTQDDQPVVGISWQDAADYAAWLSKITGRAYRLPSETEWEYAARAGTTTVYWWGDGVKRNAQTMACCKGCGSERDADGLFDVTSFLPNPWGLHHVHGNVWEWVADFYCESYASTPQDGRPKTEKSCPKQQSPEGLKVFRGGSCFFEARQMRAAMRLRNWPSFRNMTVGFRVARSL